MAGLSMVSAFAAIRPAAAQNETSLAVIEGRHGGRLGVFALDTGSGRTLAHRADERFLMCSTFKGLLAGLVLARVDAGKENLSRMIPYTDSDLIFTSPVTKAHVSQGAMAVGDLTQAILEYSDNTAAILLMRSAGGPAGLTAFVRRLGDTVTRSDRYEPLSNHYSGELDTTSPRAIVASAQKLLLSDVLTPESKSTLEVGMKACKPGVRRIRASLPAGWTIGDRPGENVTEESNDYAIVRPTGRAPLLIAVYYNAPNTKIADREAVIREVGDAFVKWAQG
ncbi:class A beta-lactamase [Acidisoma silvae]|uniref:Beta-lactamase n=1 Tax=Acidisoma silvae TaxID=2802396 RepID=A0A963YXJ1_9PROT|nr:class A beta-lactamase [Acidisoma silvae]MCB8877973.1 class A beta-lactamase [Acidisoma silvae]